ncbi:MAG: extensin family protein [Rhizobiaceae bacterium]
MTLVRIDNIAGIPLYYDRYKSDSYGKSAVPMRPYINQAFLNRCTPCFDKLSSFLGTYGKGIEQIWSGGVGRAGTGTSYHHTNRAFDLDALILADGDRWIATSFPERPHIYVAIESFLRTQFGTVLNYQYNAAHQYHFHFDNGTNPGFNKYSKSRVTYLQNAIKYGFGGSLAVDGVWGPQTEVQTKLALKALGLGSLSINANWQSFLLETAKSCMDSEMAIVTA